MRVSHTQFNDDDFPVEAASPSVSVNYMPEQKAIIESTEPSIRVSAFAGTGKTTTLVGYASRRKNSRMLYMAFNKAIQEEAARKFTANVTCKTTHSIAYHAMDVRNNYAKKLSFGLKPFDLSTPFNSTYIDAANAILILNNFMSSADDRISENNAIAVGIKPSMRARALDLAREAWKCMINPDTDKVFITHDGYLKLFQLSGKPIGDYGTIMFDEAQDANPVTTALVMASTANKVFVGDRHQSIYGFRGAKNAMEEMVGLADYPLSSSFRFGQQVADAANVILRHTLGEERHGLKGLGGKSSIDFSSNAAGHRGQIAKLARTNGTILDMTSGCMESGTPFHIIGGAESLKLNLVMDTFYLSVDEKDKIFNPQIKQFNSFDEMQNLSEESDDPEYKAMCKVVKRHGKGTPGLVASVKSACLPSTNGASVIFSTAHKSKGLEFEAVQLMDDFPSLMADSQVDGIDIQEGNLIYVAMTRAKNKLYLNDDIMDFIDNPVRNKLLGDPGIRSMVKRGV